MNGKYYGKLEIRWHSREKERLEHIRERKDNNESVRRNHFDMGHRPSTCFGSISAKLLAGTQH